MRIAVLTLFFLLSLTGFSQSAQLAENYFEQGEFEKALHTYEKLAAENPNNPAFFYGMLSSYQQMEDFAAAERLLQEKIQGSANRPELLVELGRNYELQGDEENAGLYYEEALRSVEARPNFAHAIGRQFEKHSLLDRAVQAYEMGMERSTGASFNVQLARLYGEKGEVGKMFESYLDLVQENNSFLPAAYRNFSQFIGEDPKAEANQTFRKILLQKLQENQDIIYNELLSWLFIQQGEYAKAFNQEKAVYRRSGQGMGRLIRLAVSAREHDPQAAVAVLEYIIDQAASEDLALQGHQMKLSLQQELAESGDVRKITKAYEEVLEEFGRGTKTLLIQTDYAEFLAFSAGEIHEGAEILKDLLDRKLSSFQEARVKMGLADILVLDGKFNQALIYYSQVQQLVENNELAQQARFKVAKTSYYKGDFEWAKTQLDVLKSSTSQLIANDAMELSLLIQDNSLEDSTQAALKMFARADLLDFQEKPHKAIGVLDSLLSRHASEPIEDEALLKRAELYQATGEFEEAEKNYLQLISSHGNGIFGDNAHFGLAQLYDHSLGQPEKAQEFYEKIIFNYADSIYFVDARRRYRQLRGE